MTTISIKEMISKRMGYPAITASILKKYQLTVNK